MCISSNSRRNGRRPQEWAQIRIFFQFPGIPHENKEIYLIRGVPSLNPSLFDMKDFIWYKIKWNTKCTHVSSDLIKTFKL